MIVMVVGGIVCCTWYGMFLEAIWVKLGEVRCRGLLSMAIVEDYFRGLWAW